MARAPLILVFDTSTSTAVVAVGRGTRTLVARHEPAPRAYDEGLLPRIDEALRAAKVRPRDLDAIACGGGPGSFTGLRIALATAKGYAFALDRPLIVVSSTAATAAGAGDVASAVVLLDAKRGQYFAQAFRLDRARGEPASRVAPRPVADELMAAERLAGWIATRRLPRPIALVGEPWPGSTDGRRTPPDGLVVRPLAHPPGASLLRLARQAYLERRFTPADSAEPTYLRPPPFNPPAGGPRGARGSGRDRP